MACIGYLYLAFEKELRIPLAEQQQAISAYSSSMGRMVEEYFVEQGVSLKQALVNRQEGKKIIDGLQAGDAIFVVQATFILGSSREASRLLETLRRKGVSLFCIDLDEDIALDGERKLVVSQGGALLVQKVLSSLSRCEGGKHGEAIRATKRTQKKEGKYLGGPVPYGWRIGAGGFLVQHLEQQRMIREMLNFREDRWSYRDITKKLREKYNLELSHEGIRRILEANCRMKEEEKERTASSQGKSNSLFQRNMPSSPTSEPGIVKIQKKSDT